MTYSIVARDHETGALGVAVQTAMFGVGSVVPWARAGVGAVATQAMGEPAYGPRCLDALASGSSADAALDAAQAADVMPPLRQVGVVGADGTAAVGTGELCIDHAGHVVGDGFTVQANMMSTPEVWPAMAAAFADSSGPLARRLLATLVTAEAAGGDARGRMSAALLVVDGAVAPQPAGGTIVDIRVDRSEDPLGDLARSARRRRCLRCVQRGRRTARGWRSRRRARHHRRSADRAARRGEFPLRPSRSAGGIGRHGGRHRELRSLIASRATWDVIVRSFAAKGLRRFPTASPSTRSSGKPERRALRCGSEEKAPTFPGAPAPQVRASPDTTTSTSASNDAGRPRELLGLCPGDAASVQWCLDCEVAPTATGVDLEGPCIQGRPNERFIDLSWGTVDRDGLMVQSPTRPDHS